MFYDVGSPFVSCFSSPFSNVAISLALHWTQLTSAFSTFWYDDEGKLIGCPHSEHFISGIEEDGITSLFYLSSANLVYSIYYFNLEE